MNSAEHRIDHLVLGIPGMYRQSVESNGSCCSVEVLVLQFAFRTAVQGVGPVGIEAFDVEEIRSAPDLFVRSETDADVSVTDLGVLLQVFDGGEDFGYPGLVVGSEQGGAVRGNKRAAFVTGQLRKICRAQDVAGAQGQFAAVVVFPQDGFDALSAGIGRGVHVGDEADTGQRLGGVGREGAHDISVGVQRDVFQSHGFHLLAEQAGQVQLFFGRGDIRLSFGGLGVYFYVAQEALQELFSHKVDNSWLVRSM